MLETSLKTKIMNEVDRQFDDQTRVLADLVKIPSTRFREVVYKYQTTSHTPEALERLVETYLNLGLPEEAHKAAAVLGANYPGSKWYRRSYELIQRHAPTAAAAQPTS